jgi:TP901 family phage tail tape measure protein
MIGQTLRFNLFANTKQFNVALTAASARMKAFGASMVGFGMRMMKISGPLALMGGGAMKMAADFDKSMTKIKTLVGLAGDQVDAMGVQVKALSKNMAVDSRQAADALFFITSAGLEGKLAMDTLAASMKASALGLGETKTVADAATSALNAYKGGNLTASGAVDVLTMAVRKGKLDTEALAGSIGKVIPIASNMGVEFHEVGAALAAMSRTGTTADIGATQLKAIMKSILDPTSEARKMLTKLGTSSEQLQTMLGEQGLLSTLKFLSATFRDNGDAQQVVFGNSRALMGVMDLMGKNMADTEQIFADMTKTAGVTDEAFKTLEQSAEFKLRKSINNLKTTFSEFGNSIMQVIGPALSKILNLISGLFNAFRRLPAGIQKAIIGVMGLVVVIPLISIAFGGVVSAFGTMIPIITGALSFLLSPIGLIIAGIVGVSVAIVKNWGAVKAKIVEFANYFITLYNESVGFRIAVESIALVFKTVFAYGKMQILNMIAYIKMIGGFIADIFGSAGKIIKAAFTLDREGLKKGLNELKGNLKETFQSGMDEAEYNVTNFADTTRKNIQKALKNVINPSEVELVDETIFDGFESWMSGKKDDFMNLFSSLNPLGNITIPDGTLTGGGDDGSGSGNGGGNGGGSGSSGGGNDAITKGEKLKNMMEEIGMTSQEMQQSVNDSFNQLSNSVVDSLGIAGTAIGDYVTKLLNMVTETITGNMTILMSEEQKLAHKQAQTTAEIGLENTLATTKQVSTAQGIASNVAKVASDTSTAGASIGAAGGEATADAVSGAAKTAKSFGPAAAFVLPILIAGAITLITKAMKKAKKFKTGGIVSGTTLGMVGEYPGARSNPEVIAPLDKLKNMLPQPQTPQMAMGGNFTVDGQDLVLALGRANENGERL